MIRLATPGPPAPVTLPKRDVGPRAHRWKHGQGCQLCFEERGTTIVAAFRIGAKCVKRLRAIARGAGVEWAPERRS